MKAKFVLIMQTSAESEFPSV